jgi:hypothetical protein
MGWKTSKQNKVKGTRCELTWLFERANHCSTAPGPLRSLCTDEDLAIAYTRMLGVFSIMIYLGSCHVLEEFHG